MPELSIILPVYNSEKYIQQSVQSILKQTYTDFELIIIDDGSTDSSLEIIHSFRDPRILVIKNERNKGIVFSRNAGLEIASGIFIAPFDSDDLAAPDKFKVQIDFLKCNPSYGMVGSWAKLIDGNNKLLSAKFKLIADPDTIPAILLFRNYFVQSSVVIRRTALKDLRYSENYPIGEDYKLWTDISNSWKVWNIPQYLIFYRIHNESTTQINMASIPVFDQKVFRYIYAPLGINLSSEDDKLLLKLKSADPRMNIIELHQLDHFLIKILKANDLKMIYKKKALLCVVLSRWIKACLKSNVRFFEIQKVFIFSRTAAYFVRSIFKK